MNNSATLLQKEIIDRLTERLDLIHLQPETILILGGSAADYLKIQLLQRYQPKQLLVADWQNIDLPDHSVDLIISSLHLQNIPDISSALQKVKQALKHNGLLHFSMLGPDSLKELHPMHITRRFADMHDIGDNLLHHKFADPVMTVEMLTLEYSHTDTLAQDLNALGLWQAEFATANHPRNSAGRLPVTYEIIYGHAWGTADPTEIRIPVSHITKNNQRK